MPQLHTDNIRRETLYLVFATFFSVLVIISNLITFKLVSIPFFTDLVLPCGLITYPLTFLISDLVTEIYGVYKAKFMVYLAFIMSIAAHFIIQLAVILPPHPEWTATYNPFGYADSAAYQVAFASVFKLNGIALFSSMASYVVAQILDIRLFAFLKELTKSRYLWLRNGGSTLIAQVIDTLVVNTLFLYCGLKLNLDTVVAISLICYLYKACFTVFNIPIFYLAVYLSNRFIHGKQPKKAKFIQSTKEERPLGSIVVTD